MLVQLGRRPGSQSATAAAAPRFLPTTLAEARAHGWDELDVVLVTGDAYVDHPAFGAALIARFLVGRGLRVGLVAQPDWRRNDDFRRLGRPRLFFGVSAGNLDSMLSRLTAQKQNRGEDPYSPGGRPGGRPDRATLVYSNRCREAFPDVPIILGGIEASLRRIAHYDYWSDAVRRPILVDAKADLLVFGMGEQAIWEVARRLRAGEPIKRIRDVRGTAFLLSRAEADALCRAPSRYVGDGRPIELPSYEAVCGRDRESLQRYARMARQVHLESNPHNARPLVQRVGARAVYLHPPALPLPTAELDGLYDLPFARAPHPSYREPIPAFETVKHALMVQRGCFGGCSFCAIAEHEGRRVQSRSAGSVLRELRALRRMDGFDGVVTDLGGATANMYMMRCSEPRLEAQCRRLSCVHPRICRHLRTDHGPLIELLRKVRTSPGVRRVDITSGIRPDLAASSPEYLGELKSCQAGRGIAVAPEHSAEEVLRLMRKPAAPSYDRFAQSLAGAGREPADPPRLVSHYIAGHPGSTLHDMVELALYLKRNQLRPQKVHDFIPLPMSLAATMYHTGLDPLARGAGRVVYVEKGLREKKLQVALLYYWDRAYQELVREALRAAGRGELIGHGAECLVPPAPPRVPGPVARLGSGHSGRSGGR